MAKRSNVADQATVEDIIMIAGVEHSKPNPQRMKLLAGTGNLPLAKKISKLIGIPLSACEHKRFSDGEVFVQINENIRGRDVFIIQSTNPPAENLIELLMLIDAARRASAKRITAAIPYFGYARADRKDQPRVSIAAKLMANLLTAAGIDRALAVDLHASQIQGFFDIPTDHLYGSMIFHQYIEDKGLKNLVVVSPDIGSIKISRAFASRLQIPLAIVDKRRPVQNRAEVMNIVGDVKGKNVIMIDDMIDTGGTITNAAHALKDQGAGNIYACCTHPVLSGQALERIAASPIRELLVSDTIDLNARTLPPNVKVLSVASLIAEAVVRISNEESLTSLFSDYV
jgi:ribose-phosphate pyrophosphokinase